MSSTFGPCPARVRAYHEAGHAALNLIYGYGLAECSIEVLPHGIGGATRRRVDLVQDGHFVKIVAAGTWAEGLSGDDFAEMNCENGAGADRLTLQAILLRTLGYPEDLDPSTLSEVERKSISSQIEEYYDQIFRAVEEEFQDCARLALVHELAELLLEHEVLPNDILQSLNERYPSVCAT